ncbi:Uncharacterized protein QTN25_006462 [Entamoeba marina]
MFLLCVLFCSFASAVTNVGEFDVLEKFAVDHGEPVNITYDLTRSNDYYFVFTRCKNLANDVEATFTVNYGGDNTNFEEQDIPSDDQWKFNITLSTKAFTYLSKCENDATYCSAVTYLSTEKIKKKQDNEDKKVIVLFDLLKDESGNVIGTNESNYKFKMIENTDDIESGGICLLFDVDEVSYVSFDINSELEIGTVTFKGIDKKTLYVIAEVSGYMPYHYTPIVVEAGSCGVAIIAILLVMFMLL